MITSTKTVRLSRIGERHQRALQRVSWALVLIFPLCVLIELTLVLHVRMALGWWPVPNDIFIDSWLFSAHETTWSFLLITAFLTVIPWLYTLGILLAKVEPLPEKIAGTQIGIFILSLIVYISVNQIDAYAQVMAYLLD
jgi:hypothetical protein